MRNPTKSNSGKPERYVQNGRQKIEPVHKIYHHITQTK